MKSTAISRRYSLNGIILIHVYVYLLLSNMFSDHISIFNSCTTCPPYLLFTLPSLSDRELFDYERFFYTQIDKKKKDHSYRVFKKVMRKGPKFPYAEEHTENQKDISVWCSNDYLGMSWHPTVTEAVR